MALAFPEVLTRLLAREDLTRDEAHDVVATLLAGELTPGQIGGLLVALRGKEVTVDEMGGMVAAMLDACESVDLGAHASAAIDTCGSGGSDQRREAAFHVSTIAGIVAAGAGARVCKHGNRKASATSGSADLLEALGVGIDLGPDGVARCVDEAGIGFCLAPRFHPGLAHAGPVRRELGVRTIFNVIAPLANPARVRRQVLGVSDPLTAPKLAAVLAARGAERAWVVFGADGLDELTTTGPSRVLPVEKGAVGEPLEIDPAGVGLELVTRDALRGGDTPANVAIARRVLGGEPSPYRDIVVLNAGAALVVAGVCDELATGVELAHASIDDGRAAATLETLIEVSNRAGLTDA